MRQARVHERSWAIDRAEQAIIASWRQGRMEVASGQRIGHGRFEVLARIGEGGAGVVYEVRDLRNASPARRGDAAAAEGMVGTVAYMSPEQLLAEESTAACDFYAVGVMLHQALTGHLPYFDRTRNAMVEKVEGPPTPVHRVSP